MIDGDINKYDDNNDLYCTPCDKIKLYEKIMIITMRTIMNSIRQDSKEFWEGVGINSSL